METDTASAEVDIPSVLERPCVLDKLAMYVRDTIGEPRVGFNPCCGPQQHCHLLPTISANRPILALFLGPMPNLSPFRRVVVSIISCFYRLLVTQGMD